MKSCRGKPIEFRLGIIAAAHGVYSYSAFPLLKYLVNPLQTPPRECGALAHDRHVKSAAGVRGYNVEQRSFPKLSQLVPKKALIAWQMEGLGTRFDGNAPGSLFPGGGTGA